MDAGMQPPTSSHHMCHHAKPHWSVTHRDTPVIHGNYIIERIKIHWKCLPKYVVTYIKKEHIEGMVLQSKKKQAIEIDTLGCLQKVTDQISNPASGFYTFWM